MICKECNTKNRIKANYCINCGYPFTDEQRETAYSKTVYGWIEKIENVWSIISLDKITGSSLFKVLSLVAVLVFGGYSIYRNGTQFRPLEHDSYQIQYNKIDNEYYLISDSEELQVSLYLPKQAEEVTIHLLNESNELISTQNYSLSDDIVLINQADILYQIEAAGKTIQIRTFKRQG